MPTRELATVTARARPSREGAVRRRRSPLGSAAEAVAVDPVVGSLWTHRSGQGQVLSGFAGTTALLERATQAEVGEIVDGIAVDDRLELDRSGFVAADSEVDAPQRLAD